MKMKKLLAAAIASLVLAVGTAQPVSAHNTDSKNTTDSSSSSNLSEIIWSGLWAGANLDISSVFSDQKPPQASPEAGAPSDQPATTGRYVALGDSVAAGAGLPPVPDANAEDQRCKRSQQAYPYEVASALNMEWQHIACSGATAGDLVTKQRPGGQNLQPQLDAAFAAGTPSLITLTAGANDADWSGFVYKCYTYRCDTDSFSRLAEARLKVLRAKLHYAFTSIKARSGSNPPEVIATGYYNPLSARCASLTDKVTSPEITWLQTEVQNLNRTIKSVSAHYPFVRYVEVDFSGHDICSADPWVQGLADADPFHPNAQGQAEIARLILDLSHNLP